VHKVPRYDYADQFADDLPGLVQSLTQMLVNGDYELGPTVGRFERCFADFIGVRHAVGVNTGTDALQIALLSLDLPPRSEIITQANTFNATVTAICRAGHRPVLVDAEEESFLLNCDALSACVRNTTRVILPVHLYGKPTPMDGILQLARAVGAHIVEDAAQSHGARLCGRRTGGVGTLAAFSFHPSKNLAAAGDAGAIVTESNNLAGRIRRLHRLGQAGKNDHRVLGVNSKLDAVQAAILLSKLPHLDVWNAARRRIAALYRTLLADTELRFQRADDQEEHVYHLLPVRLRERDRLQEFLLGRGIDVIVRYPVPIHLQPAFSFLGYREGDFPVAERLSRELLCLPIRPNLQDWEVAYVCDSIKAFLGQ
jgi:dTDP-4-amino-4,6-dideoxygalactose transaminase